MPPALSTPYWFGEAQHSGNERMEDWTEFHGVVLGFKALFDEDRRGILLKGCELQSPCGSLHLQLIAPEPGILDVEGDESLQRIGLDTPDVLANKIDVAKSMLEMCHALGAWVWWYRSMSG